MNGSFNRYTYKFVNTSIKTLDCAIINRGTTQFIKIIADAFNCKKK
jgi:hypothetical protein